MVEADAVLQVSDDVLDDGMAAVVGLEVQGPAVAVGDEGVIVVGGEQGELAARGGLDPSDDEAHLRVLVEKGPVRGFSHIGAAVDPVGNGRPVLVLDDVDHLVQSLDVYKRQDQYYTHLSHEDLRADLDRLASRHGSAT